MRFVIDVFQILFQLLFWFCPEPNSQGTLREIPATSPHLASRRTLRSSLSYFAPNVWFFWTWDWAPLYAFVKHRHNRILPCNSRRKPRNPVSSLALATIAALPQARHRTGLL